MKGVKKCFGLLFLCSTIFGLSLSVCSGVTNALKYPISTIDIDNPTYEFAKLKFSDGVHNVYFDRVHNLSIGFNQHSDIPSDFRFPHTWRFSGNYLSDSNTCELASYSDGVDFTQYTNSFSYSLNSLSHSYNLYSLNSYDSPFNLSSSLSSGNNSWLLDSSRKNLLCSISNFAYTSHTETPPPIDSNMPRWNWVSLINIPLVNERFAYENSKPYYYNFNKLYLIGTDRIDGVYQKRYGLKMSQIFGTKISTFSNLNFYFSLFDDPVNRLDYENSPETVVSNFNFVGSIYFDSDYTFNSNCNFNSTCLELAVNNYNVNQNSSFSDHSFETTSTLPDNSSLSLFLRNSSRYYSSSSCTITQYHVSNGDSENKIDFSCPYTPSSSYLSSNIDFRLLEVSLHFGGPSGYTDTVLQTDGDYTFKDFYIITNNDDTYIDWDATGTASGGDLSESPGYGLGGGGATESDWTMSLQNLFGFSFINPFAPLFELFSGQDSCVSIPTLSSMLHSEETEVCPWFDSTTRGILTPVLSLSSVMLVFGFAVHWLGARSGNLFEDSVETDNYKFENKFRRKK